MKRLLILLFPAMLLGQDLVSVFENQIPDAYTVGTQREVTNKLLTQKALMHPEVLGRMIEYLSGKAEGLDSEILKRRMDNMSAEEYNQLVQRDLWMKQFSESLKPVEKDPQLKSFLERQLPDYLYKPTNQKADNTDMAVRDALSETGKNAMLDYNTFFAEGLGAGQQFRNLSLPDQTAWLKDTIMRGVARHDETSERFEQAAFQCWYLFKETEESQALLRALVGYWREKYRKGNSAISLVPNQSRRFVWGIAVGGINRAESDFDVDYSLAKIPLNIKETYEYAQTAPYVEITHRHYFKEGMKPLGFVAISLGFAMGEKGNYVYEPGKSVYIVEDVEFCPLTEDEHYEGHYHIVYRDELGVKIKSNMAATLRLTTPLPIMGGRIWLEGGIGITASMLKYDIYNHTASYTCMIQNPANNKWWNAGKGEYPGGRVSVTKTRMHVSPVLQFGFLPFRFLAVRAFADFYSFGASAMLLL